MKNTAKCSPPVHPPGSGLTHHPEVVLFCCKSVTYELSDLGLHPLKSISLLIFSHFLQQVLLGFLFYSMPICLLLNPHVYLDKYFLLENYVFQAAF